MSRHARFRFRSRFGRGFAALPLACALILPGATTASAQAKPAPSATAANGRAAAPSFEALSKGAGDARQAGRLGEAERQYRRALALRPAWLEGRWALATLFYDRDRFKDARDQFLILVEARPGDAQALALLGLSRAKLGENEAALDALLKARQLGVASDQVRSVVAFQAAVLTNRLGDPDGAFELLRPFAIDGDDRPAVIEAFGLATLRAPLLPADVPEAKREMVMLAGRGGFHMARARRSDLGRLALEELVSRYPSEPNVHYALGMYLMVDDPATAIEEWRRELGVSPGHSAARIQIAMAELRRGRADAALPVASEAARLAPTVPAAHLILGRALVALGRFPEGLQELQQAVKLAPDNPRLHFALAQALNEAGRPEDAARERAEFQRLQGASGAAASAATTEPRPDSP